MSSALPASSRASCESSGSASSFRQQAASAAACRRKRWSKPKGIPRSIHGVAARWPLVFQKSRCRSVASASVLAGAAEITHDAAD